MQLPEVAFLFFPGLIPEIICGPVSHGGGREEEMAQVLHGVILLTQTVQPTQPWRWGGGEGEAQTPDKTC